MLEIAKIANNLRFDPNGYWTTERTDKISFPVEGNEFCAELEDNSFWFKHRNEIIMAAIKNFPSPGVIFDVGGGNGFVAQKLETEGFGCVVVEPGETGAINAVRRGIKQVICATLENADFQPGSLPAVGLFDVLEHIENDAAFLRRLKKLLVANGRIYLTVPAYNLLWSSEDEYAGHFRRYTLGSLAKVLKYANFRVEYATCFFAVLPPAIFLLRTAPDKLGFHRDFSIAEAQNEHAKRSGLFGNLLNRTFNYELSRVRQRKTLPIGASILVVARS